jgi:hypothetical protein
MTVHLGLRLRRLTDVSERRRRRGTWLVVAVACLDVVECGVAGPTSRTFVGPVTAVSPRGVCIGGRDAGGECFVRNRMTRSLRVSDCVRVTYTLHDSPGPSSATRIEQLDTASHAIDCPHR